VRKVKQEDYITKTVGYDYPKEYTNYKNDVLDFFKKVFPNEEVRDYVMHQHAQALSGRKGKDLIHCKCGIGSNGKSIEIEIMKQTFGQYYVNIPIKMLIIQNNNGCNTPDPFFTKLKGVRYASSNEPPDGSKINDTFIKQIGSQEEQEYRLLFSNIISTLTLQLKLHIYSNEKLKIKGEDGGISRRMRVIDYVSRFDEISNEKYNIYKIDYSLNEKVKLWRGDYMKMLIELYDRDYMYSCPKTILDSSQQYLDDNNDVLKFIRDNLTMTNNDKDYLLLKDLKELYKMNKEYDQIKLKNLKELLQQTMKTIFYERKKINGMDYRMVIIGWKLNDD
jgi:putative DNA primase/helicase